LRRRLRAIDGSQDRLVRVDGCEVVNFSSNNYLGLANHPTLAEAAARAARELGTGAGASRLIVGNMAPHRRLESALAGYFRFPAAVLFNSGYQANVGVLQALAGREDAVYSDELNHASIIDGCRLSRARVHVYPHADVAALEALMARTHREARRRFIVSDALFSMDGDRAPVRELAALARRYDAALIVDEAHAAGAFGPDGRGVAADAGVMPDVVVGTLGKAFGSFGAFALAARAVTELIVNRARSFVFTTALPPAVCAAGLAALELAAGEEGGRRRDALRANAKRLSRGLRECGLGDKVIEDTAVFPVLVGAEAATMKCADLLLSKGYYAQGIRPPTVPSGTSRLRIAVMANHEEREIDGLVEALSALADEGVLPRGRRQLVGADR